MKRIFFLLFLLPFSLFAEIDPTDLDYIEGRLGVIADSSDLIEADVNLLVEYINELVARANELVSEQNATQSQIEKIRSLIASLNSTLESFRADFNNILPTIEYDVYAILTTVRSCKEKLDSLVHQTGNLYDALRPLVPISEDLALIKTLLSETFESLQSSITTITTLLEDVSIKVQSIYDELLSQGLDIKDIRNFLQKIFSGSYSIWQFSFKNYDSTKLDWIGSPSSSKTFAVEQQFSDFSSFLEASFSRMLVQLGNLSLIDQNQVYRLYDIQTNLYSSIKLQTDISTNVAYIASVITNSHDLLKLIASNVVNIARHTMPTNIADQYETEQQEQIGQISSNYQDHENDMNQYESQLTRLPGSVQNRFDDSLDYISRLSSSNLSVDRLDDQIFASFPDYHSSLANMSFSLPIDIQLTPDVKQIFGILRKCVTTTIWIFTFLFTLFMIQKFLQFLSWIMGLLNPNTRDVFGNTSSGSLNRLMGG